MCTGVHVSEPDRAINYFVLIPAEPKEVPEVLLKLPPSESVRCRLESDGIGGEGAFNAETLRLYVETVIARQHIDRFTVDEAAFILARATADTWENWQQRIVKAINDETLHGYGSECVAPRLEPMRLLESCLVEVYGDDVNSWLASSFKRVMFRFPQSLDSAPSNEAFRQLPKTSDAIQRSQAQDAAILDAIRAAGHQPKSLPKNPSGKPGVKAQIRAKVTNTHPGLFPAKSRTFDKAWDRLRSFGDVADSKE